VALEEPEIECTDPNILIENNCMDEELHFVMPGASGDYEDEADKSEERNPIPTTTRRQWAMTELERFDLETSGVDRYKGDDGDDADEEEEARQADDGSMQNVEDWGHQ